MIADVIDLMLKSPLHRDFFIKDLERVVIPAIQNDRLVLVHEEDKPVGMYSFTFLTPVAEAGYLYGTRKIQPKDWETSSDDGILYMIDLIAPYKNAIKIARIAQDDIGCRGYERAEFIRRKVDQTKRLGFAYVPKEMREVRSMYYGG